MKRAPFVVVAAALLLGSCAPTGPGHGSAHSGALVEEVRRGTSVFRDPAAATGYAPFLGCVSAPGEGAMGVHLVNGDLVGDGELDAQRPEALIYEPTPDGLRLVGVEFIVMAEGWHAHHKTPPTLMGQVFHYTASPNRYGIPAFYSLHVWAWKDNPQGPFADWNPRVSCQAYSPPAPTPPAKTGAARN